MRPMSGSTPTRPGNWTEVASASVSGAISRGRWSSAASRSVVEAAVQLGGGRAAQLRPISSGPSTAARRYSANGISAASPTNSAKMSKPVFE